MKKIKKEKINAGDISNLNSQQINLINKIIVGQFRLSKEAALIATFSKTS